MEFVVLLHVAEPSLAKLHLCILRTHRSTQSNEGIPCTSHLQGPCRARYLEIWKSGTWKSGILDLKNGKNQILKIKIRVAQNVGKVWINGKNPSPIGDVLNNFHGQENYRTRCVCLFSLVGQSWMIFQARLSRGLHQFGRPSSEVS